MVVGLTTHQETTFVQEMKYVVSVRYEEAFNYEPFNVPAALTKDGHSFNPSKSALLRKLHKDASSSEKLHLHTKDHL